MWSKYYNDSKYSMNANKQIAVSNLLFEGVSGSLCYKFINAGLFSEKKDYVEWLMIQIYFTQSAKNCNFIINKIV